LHEEISPAANLRATSRRESKEAAMNRLAIRRLPTALTLIVVALAVVVGPIPQFAHYHDFADQRAWLGIPNAADVLSNLGFAVVGAWGLVRLWRRGYERTLGNGWSGYTLFLVALVLTTFGSIFYHLAPDNARLVWDRMPIALACAGLLSGVRSELVPGARASRTTTVLAVAAILSVLWWKATDFTGEGDLRPYLIFQLLPLLLIPLWQYIYGADRADRVAFGCAFGLYTLAKVTELYDHPIFAQLSSVSGHTLKHLLATAAAAVIVARLVRPTPAPHENAATLPSGALRDPSLKNLRIVYERFRVPVAPR
jgi:hypothetical protein